MLSLMYNCDNNSVPSAEDIATFNKNVESWKDVVSGFGSEDPEKVMSIFADSLNMSNVRLNARTKLFNIFDITFSSDYDPYLTNENKNNRINQFEIATNKRLARLKSFTTSISINVNDKSHIL